MTEELAKAKEDAANRFVQLIGYEDKVTIKRVSEAVRYGFDKGMLFTKNSKVDGDLSEELEKEAKDWVEANTKIESCPPWGDVKITPSGRQGYLAGAEPREKKITELKEQFTIAKDILTKILQRMPSFEAKSIEDLSLLNALSQAEQFLNREV